MKIQKINDILFHKGKFIRVFYTDPLMFFTQHHFFRDYSLGTFIPPPVFKNRQCYLFSADNWYWSDTKYRVSQHKLILDGYYSFINDYPKCTVIFCHPDKNSILGYPNIPNVIFNRNAMLDPDDYVVNPKPIIWDAIYNATFYKYKRHELIYNLKNNIALIYYLRNSKSSIYYIHDDELIYGQNMRNKFKKKDNMFLLNDIYGYYKFLSLTELSEAYNKSVCGLCLSDVEGACLVSMEYLLSGLPVVSTKNIGGRDYFLKDSEYALIDVNDDEDSILNAIEYFKSIKLNRYDIKNSTLEKINNAWDLLFIQLKNYMNINIIDKKLFRYNLINIWKDYTVL